MTEKTLVMVLGMHRSGTSAITKGLQTLGVSLSENLLEGSEANKKGYWEDLDVLAINEKLLHYAGLEWYSPVTFPIEKLEDPYCQALIDEAVCLLKKKVSEHPLWGFKDPRSSRLLPFWLHVFKQAKITPKFILSIRNPLDVALSLKKRDELEYAHSNYLWLLHILPNISTLTEFDYAIVDFSSLLDNPTKCMQHVAKSLKLTINEQFLSEFSDAYLDSSLCHSSSKLSDLIASEHASDLLVNTYKTLLSDSLDTQIDDGRSLNDTFVKFTDEFVANQSLLSTELLNSSYPSFFRLLHEKNKIVHEQNLLTMSFNELQNDNQSLLAKIVDLESENQSKINQIEERLGLVSTELTSAHTQLNLLYQSTSWKLTIPLRAIKRVISGDWHSIKLGIYHRVPLLVHAFNPVAGGFSARVKRALIFLKEEGLSAFIKKIKNVKANKEFTSAEISDYQTWLENHHHQEQLDAQKIIDVLPEKKQPLISVVMPTYNTDEKFLRLCIESVLNQSYENWELCIADDASPDPQVVKVLKEYQEKDKRVKIICRQQNGHISAATNSALELVTGEWVALLDHDDELHTDALAFVVNALNEQPDTQFIYSDEDKIDEQGGRSSPHFKSDWNLDLLYSQNYVSHLGVYKADIVKKIGGFRVGYEGSQDFDLLLRYSREIDHKNIIHIPRVLYHWRMVEGSTALASDEKSYTTEAGIKALNDYFFASGENVRAERGMADNIYKTNWSSVDSEGEALVSLIIPTYNGYEITKQAIDSILSKTIYQNFEILLVDNNSNDPIAVKYFEEIANHEKVTLLRYPYPFNYSAINNFAAKHAKGSILGLINNDIEVINSEWLTEMVSHAQRKDIGCVGAMLYYPNDTIQHAGVIIGIQGVANHSHKHFERNHPGYFRRLQVVQNFSAVTAACLLVKKAIFNEVNGLNEKDLAIAFNDIDFCLKVQKAGYRNLWTPYAELYHHESVSRGAEDNPEKIARFNKEVEYMKGHWKTDQISDFAYNPNLTRSREDFSLKNIS